MSEDILETAKYVLGKRDLFGSQDRDEHSEDCAYIHPHCLIDGLVKEIARLREERRWVPVGERLPEMLQNVLVCSSRGIHCASLDSRGQWLDEDENPGKKITHWQPLPPGTEASGTELPTG